MIASLKTTAQKNIDTTIYQFKVENIEGEEFNLILFEVKNYDRKHSI